MGRMDYKRGRFSVDYETNSIRNGLVGWQRNVGDTILYYRYDGPNSYIHPVYDEPIETGLAWKAPINMPVIHVVHFENERDIQAEGEYSNDTATVTAAYEMLRRAGLSHLDVSTLNYLNDRFIYDDKVFKVLQISVLGQINARDVIASIEATQVKPDELVASTVFAKYAQP